MAISVGILGGGQLGRMLALAGYPWGLNFATYDSSATATAGQICDLVVGSFQDEMLLASFAEGLQVITYETENVPIASARRLNRYVPVYPPPDALAAAQERFVEKTFLAQLGIPTPRFCAVESEAALRAGVAEFGWPAVLKTRRFGYDGKGQWLLRTPADLTAAWAKLGGEPLILESFVPFTREVSLLAVRDRAGQTRFYPLVENHHVDGMLRRSRAPAPNLTATLQALAEDYGHRILTALNYVGVLAVEFFQVGDRLLANEIAPRVHNSGHWTIEGAATSQFANHLRAILGWPLGETTVPRPVAMVNLIGRLPDPARLLALPNVAVHFYGKQELPGRKLGHVTLWADDPSSLQNTLQKVDQLLATV